MAPKRINIQKTPTSNTPFLTYLTITDYKKASPFPIYNAAKPLYNTKA